MKAKKLLKEYSKLSAKEKIKFDHVLEVKREFDRLEKISQNIEMAISLLKETDIKNGKPIFNKKFVLGKIMNFSNKEIKEHKEQL